MSSLADDLAPITSVLTAAAGPAGAVTAVANFLTEIGKIVEPILSEDETQKYADERTATIQQATQILSEADGPDREQRLADFFSQLLLNAGVPITGGVGNVPLVGVRVEFLLAAAAGLAGKVYDDKYLTAVLAKATGNQPVAPASPTVPTIPST